MTTREARFIKAAYARWRRARRRVRPSEPATDNRGSELRRVAAELAARSRPGVAQPFST
jgi:hypothetical protein